MIIDSRSLTIIKEYLKTINLEGVELNLPVEEEYDVEPDDILED